MIKYSLFLFLGLIVLYPGPSMAADTAAVYSACETRINTQYVLGNKYETDDEYKKILAELNTAAEKEYRTWLNTIHTQHAADSCNDGMDTHSYTCDAGLTNVQCVPIECHSTHDNRNTTETKNKARDIFLNNKIQQECGPKPTAQSDRATRKQDADIRRDAEKQQKKEQRESEKQQDEATKKFWADMKDLEKAYFKRINQLRKEDKE